MAALAYSIQSPVRSFTIPSSKIQLCRSYGCFAIAPKPAEEKGLLWSSQTKTFLVPKSSNLGFRLNGSSMGFRKCSFSSCAKGGDGDVESVPVPYGIIFIGSMVAITASAAQYISPAMWRAIFIFGVGISFAARDILGNLQGWLDLKLSQRFSVGDTIKVASVEGKVVKMGLFRTWLLSEQNSLITVPNSLFSSQAFLILSQAHGHGLVTTIRICTDDHAKSERAFYSAQQDILVQAIDLIKRHGATIISWIP